MTPDHVVTGRLPAALTDVEQPLPAVENGRPVVDCETARETSGAVLGALLLPHRHECDCGPCVELRTNLAAITEAERRAWETSHDIFIR